ncbi:MAG TPA: dephospho-CoA kinase [archaeon]|nr:dephospho-CoA kinase [archaeon]
MLIAVTGSFASGKTTFCRLLEKDGSKVFYADEFVSRLYTKGKILSKVRETFGSGVFSNGTIDKRALAQKAFSSKSALEKLNSIIHPHVRKALKEIRHEGKIVFAEVPVLFESGMDSLFDEIILLKCQENVAIARALKSGFPREEFLARCAFQLHAHGKEKKADFVVDSDCPISALRSKAQSISRELTKILLK